MAHLQNWCHWHALLLFCLNQGWEFKMFLLNLSAVQYEQVYWIAFCLGFTLFFQTSYFFSLKYVGTLMMTSDPPYVGGRYDTCPTVEHPNNTFTVFLFYK